MGWHWYLVFHITSFKTLSATNKIASISILIGSLEIFQRWINIKISHNIKAKLTLFHQACFLWTNPLQNEITRLGQNYLLKCSGARTSAGTRNRYLTWHGMKTHTGRTAGWIDVAARNKNYWAFHTDCTPKWMRTSAQIPPSVSQLNGDQSQEFPHLTHIKPIALCWPSGAWLFGGETDKISFVY